jgi:hypothetical protein
MTITLSSSDTALLSSVIIWWTTVATVSLLANWQPDLTDLFSEIPFVADTSAFSALCVVADVVCLDVMQLRRTAVVMWT